MAMAADVIVAQSLTITGSIGVVLGKFNLQELYRRVGYTKTPISRGRCAKPLGCAVLRKGLLFLTKPHAVMHGRIAMPG